MATRQFGKYKITDDENGSFILEDTLNRTRSSVSSNDLSRLISQGYIDPDTGSQITSTYNLASYVAPQDQKRDAQGNILVWDGTKYIPGAGTTTSADADRSAATLAATQDRIKSEIAAEKAKQTGVPTVPNQQVVTPKNTQSTNVIQAKSSPLQISGSNLKIGSAGDDVKSLQTYLKGIGLYQGKVDGIFGPQTQTAVKQFQSSNGLTSDGIVGPKTIGALQAVQGGQNIPQNALATEPTNNTSNPYSTGDPQQDSLLEQLSTYVNDLVNKGYTINPDLNIDDSTIAKFLDQAQKEINPYYAQMIEGEKQKLARDLGQTAEQYGNEVKNQEVQFGQNLDNARESYADRGLTFSGQRGLGEQNMLDAQNRSLQSLSSQYGNQFSNVLQGAEQKLGTANLSGFKLPELSTYGASLTQKGFNPTGSSSTYTPGTYQIGSIPAERNQATQTYKNQLLSEAYKRADSGLSYNDLFK